VPSVTRPTVVVPREEGTILSAARNIALTRGLELVAAYPSDRALERAAGQMLLLAEQALLVAVWTLEATGLYAPLTPLAPPASPADGSEGGDAA
jgi:hypothetical protein